MSETIYLEVDGRSMDVQVTVPAGEGPYPSVLLLFHRGGMDACTEHYVKELSMAGYLVVVPNFYHHCPKDVPLHDCKQFLKDKEVIDEMISAAEYAAGRHDIDNDRLFVMGHCMGGRLAFLAASVAPVFAAAIVYYSGGMMTRWGDGAPTPFELLSDIKCPVYGFFAELDTNPSPADVDRIESEIARHGIPHLFHRYPKAKHGFQNPVRANRSPDEVRIATEAWAKTMALMRAHGTVREKDIAVSAR